MTGTYRKGGYWVLPDLDKTKKFVIVDKDKIVSKHVNFYLAQTGSERGIKKGKLSNDYKILSISDEIVKKIEANRRLKK